MNVSITAKAKHDYEFIRQVDVYANDKLIGSAYRIDAEGFRFTWINVPEGQYTLKAVAMNRIGIERDVKDCNYQS